MKIKNTHERTITAKEKNTLLELGVLLDNLGSDREQLWAPEIWPPMKLKRGLATGSKGGHGPIQYKVAIHNPGQQARFSFLNRPGLARGLRGYHELELIARDGNSVTVRHTIQARINGSMYFKWPLIVKPLHNALLEDALDLAQFKLEGGLAKKARHNLWVKILLGLLPLLVKKPRLANQISAV